MKLIKILLLTVLFGLSYAAHSLPSDSEQPVTIDSNSASYDEKTGISIYTGNVVTKQGSLHITSDKLVITIVKGDIEKLVFTGNPARFKQLPREGKEEFHGQGLTGEYYPKQNKLILIEKAVVSQGSSRSASRIIEYDSKNALVKAGNKASDRERVHSIFGKEPENK